ncbi:hypothetical protein LR48_Vigan04g136900 [Vigna angularis]|uniref:Uncharacterized protein n=1 Tax=Phaseolus angularis TaxID=3914 RepID=A0A0L9UEM3_PHAAN|nr:hypothetical protein LR48_Vigan04g136900 [Vigna angularis]
MCAETLQETTYTKVDNLEDLFTSSSSFSANFAPLPLASFPFRRSSELEKPHTLTKPHRTIYQTPGVHPRLHSSTHSTATILSLEELSLEVWSRFHHLASRANTSTHCSKS